MNFTRARLVLAVLLLAAAGGGAFAYLKYRRISNYLASQLGGQAAKQIGRQVRFKSVSFTPLKGVVLREVCVSRKPDFSKGSFFCAEKAVIRPKLSELLRNRVYFARIAFDKPVLKVREKNGRWDFEDLLALLPETDKGLYLTWNADELTMNGAVLEADLETSGLSLALENASLKLEHYSSFGGNYGLAAQGRVKTIFRGKLVSAEVALDTDANFEYGGLSYTKGGLSLEKVAYGAVTLERFRTDWTLFNLRKPLAEKNCAVSFSAGGLLVPGQENSARDSVAKGLELFSAAMGKPAPKIEDIEMSELSAAFSLNDSALAIKDLRLRTNFLSLDGALALDGPGKKADAQLRAELGTSRLELSATGPLGAPEIKPLLSATLTARFKSALADLENSLLKLFPVTGEPHV